MASDRPNSISSARRLALRSSIAAGATVVTLLGAQTLAINNRLNGFLDSAPTDASVSIDTSAAVLPTTDALLPTSLPVSVTPSPTVALPPQPPQLVVVRQQAAAAQANGVYQPVTASGTPMKPTIQPTVRPTHIPSATPMPTLRSIPSVVPTIVQPVYIQPAVVQPAPRTRSSRR